MGNQYFSINSSYHAPKRVLPYISQQIDASFEEMSYNSARMKVDENQGGNSSAAVGSTFASPSVSSPLPFLRFEIEDHGIGLSEEVMKNLFSPFKQGQRLAGGTGTFVNTSKFLLLNCVDFFRVGIVFLGEASRDFTRTIWSGRS